MPDRTDTVLEVTCAQNLVPLAMDSLKLIDLVREYTFLYDPSNKWYSDNQKKDIAWKEIAKKLRVQEQDCRKTWALLRDSFRRAIKKQKKNNQVNVTCKKWRYQDEMSFLIPFMKERSTLCILTPQADDNDDYDVTLDSESSIPSLDYSSDKLATDNSFNLNSSASLLRPIKRERSNHLSEPFKNHASEETSAALMKYLDNKRNCDDVEQFFASMATTVKFFPPRERAIAKAKVFELISKMEIDILSNPSTSDNQSPMSF